MNKDFPRILTLLREEKGLSQKKAAADLGISQPLLSHYEKGIRECGLDFLVKAADYYEVSCDYLLGRTANKTGGQIVISDIPEDDSSIFSFNDNKSGLITALNKKLIFNSLNIIFDILEKLNNKGLTTECSNHNRMFKSSYGSDILYVPNLVLFKSKELSKYVFGSGAYLQRKSTRTSIYMRKQRRKYCQRSANYRVQEYRAYKASRTISRHHRRTIRNTFKLSLQSYSKY